MFFPPSGLKQESRSGKPRNCSMLAHVLDPASRTESRKVQMEVAIVRDPAALPTTDDGEHTIIAVALCDNVHNDDPCDQRFSLTFQTASGRACASAFPPRRCVRWARRSSS
jgi:hypothetical protein